MFEELLDAPRSSCVCWRHSRCSLEHLRVGGLCECLMDAHDIHPVDIVCKPHTLTLHTWEVMCLVAFVFPLFWVSSQVMTSATLGVHPRGVSEDVFARLVLGFITSCWVLEWWHERDLSDLDGIRRVGRH